jgi:hypothetical protein
VEDDELVEAADDNVDEDEVEQVVELGLWADAASTGGGGLTIWLGEYELDTKSLMSFIDLERVIWPEREFAMSMLLSSFWDWRSTLVLATYLFKLEIWEW